MINIHLLSESLKRTMAVLGITPAELADALGVSDRTLARWLADETHPQHEARRKLADLEQLTHRLQDSFASPEAIAEWLHTESGYFGGLRPLDALSRGRIDAVDAALESILSGIFV